MFYKPLVKTAMVLGGVALVGGLIFGRDAVSYVKTAGNEVQNAVKSEVPLDFEIARAHQMVEELVPDIRHCMHVIAEQEVEIESLRNGLDKKQVTLEEQKATILALREDLRSGRENFVFAGKSYTQQQIERDLALRFERFKYVEETVERDRQILGARERALQASQEKLDTMLAARQELEVELEHLQARLKTLQAAEAASELQIDDSQLSRARKLIRELDKQIDVKEKLLDAEGQFTGLIPIEDGTVEGEDLQQEIDDYFGSDRPAEQPAL